MRAKSKTYEISLTFKKPRPGDIEIVKRVLLSNGLKQQNLIELRAIYQHSLLIYPKTLEQSRKIKKKLRDLSFKNVEIKSSTLNPTDWQKKWQDDFKPFRLTKCIDVVPTWEKENVKANNRKVLYINTVLAFGTGLHATTRFMANFIERCQSRFKSFFDIGTGTGILSLVALKSGATEVKAIDISKDSVKTAKDNFLENGYPVSNIQAINFKKFKSSTVYDFVAANLITEDLVDFGRKIVRCVKPGKYLAVSGISIRNYPIFRKTFDQFPLKCLKIEKAEGWYAVLYRKIDTRKTTKRRNRK